MSTVDFNELQYCGQCGKKLQPDKICRNRNCPAYGYKSSPSYPSNAPTVPNRITRILDDILDDTLPALSTPKNNKRRVIVLTILILILILATFIGVQIGKGSIPGTTSATQNTPSHNTSPNSGTTPVNGNATTTVAVPTQAPTLPPSPIPSPTPCPNPCVLYQENGSDNWQGWALSTEWRVVSQGLLVSITYGSDNIPSAIAPYSIPAGLSNFAVEAVIQLPDGYRSHFTGVGMAVCGSTQGNWQGYAGGLISDSWGPQAQIVRNSDELGYLRLDPGSGKHTYRFEIRGNQLTLKMDNAAVVNVTDTTFLQCGPQIGLWNSQGVAWVSSFKVIAL